MSSANRWLSVVTLWDRVPGRALWPQLNLALAVDHDFDELPVGEAVPAPASVDASDGVADWYRARFARFPASPEQLAEYERLACQHRRDPQEPLLCRVCRTVFPCLPHVDARAALVAAHGGAAEFDRDPLVRMSARVLAAQRAAEGFAALLLPLLAEARRVVAAHRPDTEGWCPVCRDPSRVGDAQVVWPCDMYRLAATVLRQGGQVTSPTGATRLIPHSETHDLTGDDHGS